MRYRLVIAICAVAVVLSSNGSAGGVSASAAITSDVTIADLEAMFPGRVGDREVVLAGLPSLNKQMRVADITNARRRAAFLTTLAYESAFLYNAHAHGDERRYAGRGYIQLTGSYNYQSAGDYLGVDLANTPRLARSLRWSAPIATWYWTVARDINPMADDLNMGMVNAAIGYPPGVHDKLRCTAFKDALRYYLGQVPDGVSCKRPKPTANLPLRAAY